MEDRETPRMRKCGESKMTRIMMATVPHVTSGSGLRKFQANGFLFNRVYTIYFNSESQPISLSMHILEHEYQHSPSAATEAGVVVNTVHTVTSMLTWIRQAIIDVGLTVPPCETCNHTNITTLDTTSGYLKIQVFLYVTICGCVNSS